MYRRLSRRPTGYKSHSTEKESKLKRSNTTRQKSTSISSESSRLSIVSELPDPPRGNTSQNRISVVSTTSSKRDSVCSNYNNSFPEDRGNYEVIDFDPAGNRPILSTPPTSSALPPPSYAPPPIPQSQKITPPESKDGHHNYFEIDFDDDDYCPVIPGQLPKGDSKSNVTHSNEFADPKQLFRRDKSPSTTSPPRHSSFMDKIRSQSGPPRPTSPPISPPGDTHLAPISFQSHKNINPSHSSVTDSEPILEDLKSVRERLLRQARDSVIAETSPVPDNTTPLIDFSKTCKTDTPSITTIRQQQQQQQPTTPIVQDDYWDHLQTIEALNGLPNKRNPPPKPPGPPTGSTINRDEIVSSYSLASDWTPAVSNNNMPSIDVSDINSMYAVATEVIDGSDKHHVQVC